MSMADIFKINGLFLKWALLFWVIVLFGGLGSGMEKEVVEPIYHGITAAGLLGLALHGVLNIYYGLIKEFSIGEIIYTAAALLIGWVGIFAIIEKMATATPLYSGAFIFIAGMVALLFWSNRVSQKESENEVKPERPLDDVTIRGGASVFSFGPNKYHLVQRNSTGKNTPAEQFERKLIRHIEKVLEVEPISRTGDKACYWTFKTPAGIAAELIVVGPGYNTISKLKDNERWLLRVREPKPGFVANWLARYFPENCSTVRDLGSSVQTQFNSSCLEIDKGLLEQEIELPLLGLTVSIAEANAHLDSLKRQSCAKQFTPEMLGFLHDLYVSHMCSLINDNSGPSLLGTKADLYRAQMFVSDSFLEKYPEMGGCEEEVYAIMNGIDLSTICNSSTRVH
jgi:hypothetical protein